MPLTPRCIQCQDAVDLRTSCGLPVTSRTAASSRNSTGFELNNTLTLPVRSNPQIGTLSDRNPKRTRSSVDGADYEHLDGVFDSRMHTARLRLGDEFIELTEYLVPKGRPLPADSRGDDSWFQHVAVIVSDIDRAYRWLRQNKVQHASSGPQRLPDWNKNAGGIQAFYFRHPDGHFLEILAFPPEN